MLDGVFGKIRLVPFRVIEVHVVEETAGEKFVGERFIFLERRHFSITRNRDVTAEIDSDADAGRVHDADGAREMLGSEANVLMEIYKAMFRAPEIAGVTG